MDIGDRVSAPFITIGGPIDATAGDFGCGWVTWMLVCNSAGLVLALLPVVGSSG